MTSQVHKNSNMTTTTHMRVAAGVLTLSLLVPSLAFAQTAVDTSVNASVGASTGGTSANVTISATVMARAKTKGDTEIDRRVKALTDMLTRISGMTKVSDQFKQNLTTNVQNQITSLTTLKTKIDADTDGATLKTDIQSITQSYRVFALVMPQARIAAAADREATIINMLVTLGSKLQARLQTAQAAGADISSLTSTLTDMGSKLSDSQTQAQAAITASATLTPDNGDATQMAANTTALKGARTDIQAAQKDLVAARKDVTTLLQGLKGLKVNTTASSTTQTQ